MKTWAIVVLTISIVMLLSGLILILSPIGNIYYRTYAGEATLDRENLKNFLFFSYTGNVNPERGKLIVLTLPTTPETYKVIYDIALGDPMEPSLQNELLKQNCSVNLYMHKSGDLRGIEILLIMVSVFGLSLYPKGRKKSKN